MKILIDFNHPAHVHLFKNFIWEMEKKGHQFCLIARDKECTTQLLDAYGFKYIKRKGYKGLKKILGIFSINWKIYNLAKKFRPDVMIGGVGNCYIAQVSWLMRTPSYIFDDTEHSTLQNWLTFPFATHIVTPSCYKLNLGKKQIKYNGYHELAYLHPKRFKPNKKILDKLSIKGKYFIVRFVEWQATHDVGDYGVTDALQLVEQLNKQGRVLISSEKQLPKELEKYRIKLKPEEIHDVMANCTLLIGESATMASECAVLGIPSIFISQTYRGYTDEEEKKYGLVFNYNNQKKGIQKALELAKRKNLKKEWQQKREKMLNDKIDVTEFMIQLILKNEQLKNEQL